MKLSHSLLCTVLLSLSGMAHAETPPPVPVGPVPSENQRAWQEMEYYAFVHFSLNTYTNRAWGFGDEKPELFNPSNVDCREWARVCKAAGMKGIILTAKHHCGFCLWPSKYTDYSVKNSPWKDGKGDLVKEMSEACREYGLKFGVYLSPWDRNRADYGKPSYIEYFRNQLTELLTNYGPVFEVWFDGANGGTGYYGGANEERKIDRTTYYDWPNTYALARKLQPNIVIWNDGGDRADLRWVGTEAGFVGETNWSLLNQKGEVPWNMLHFGLEDGDSWVPAEVNTSIRPEWFYHPEEDTKVKTVPQLVDTYFNSIGRNGTLLLNFPITPDGRIHPLDEKAVLGFADVIQQNFKTNLALNASVSASNVRGQSARYAGTQATDTELNTYWSTDDHVRSASLTLSWKTPTFINRLLLQEFLPLGQRVKAFAVDARINEDWKEVAHGTTVGYKRILRFPGVQTDSLRIRILDSKASPVISNIGVFNAPVILDAPEITRDAAGAVSIASSDVGPVFHYTTDGSEPTLSSTRFTAPFPCDGKVVIRAIASDPSTNAVSAPGTVIFDISRASWKILSPKNGEENHIIDGSPATVCHQDLHTFPADLIVDLGAPHVVSGFNYTPDRGQWGPGVVSKFRLLLSVDGQAWETVDEGEFANIKNNPVLQTRRFAPKPGRFVKFQALQTTEDSTVVGYAEFGVITD